MRINQAFKAHPIGQGFFYSGKIRAGAKEFNFIFDCGSLSYSVLNDTIDRFREVNDDSVQLDLLVISHFDADHINGLKRVLGTRKVKKIIAPFIGFKERFTLALRFANNFEETDLDLDPFNSIDTIIDFTSVLSNNIDENTEIFFVKESNGDSPAALSNSDFVIKDIENIENFDFQFENPEDLTQEDKSELNLVRIINPKKVDCSNKASLSNGYNLNIMDFIFYKKKIGIKEQLFYNEVFKLFKEENKAEFKDILNPEPNEIIDVIKKLKGASSIKKLFEVAAKTTTLGVSVNDLKDLNTTSLCMLHNDRLLKFFQNTSNTNNQNLLIDTGLNLNTIQIFNDKEIQFVRDEGYSHYRYYDRLHYYNFSHPNILLTSDSFLKDIRDVNEFIEHFKAYWDSISIFQVPHHGSKNSSDKVLFSQVPINKYKFINYGVNHIFIKRWSHPNDSVINDLVATGHSNKLLPVNEYSGYELQFDISLYNF